MNKFGIHSGVFIGGWSAAETRHAVEMAAGAGYDLLEIAASSPDDIDSSLLKRLLQEQGLEASASMGLAFDADVNNENPRIVERGMALVRKALEMTVAIGSRSLCGCLYTTLGKYSGPPTARARANAVDAIREIAREADDYGVTLSLEVVNRYETNLLNTTRQALQFIDDVGMDNVGIHLDSYHMNIEEGDFRRPVLEAGNRLNYVHIGESHRGYLGSGTIDFPGLFRALVETGYRGPIAFESFSSAVLDSALSNNLAVWRNLWDDSDDLARHALRFMQDGMHSARTSHEH